jgi:hypothetical protein
MSPMRSNGLDQAMRSGWIFGIGLVVLSAIASAPARAEGPGPEWKRLEENGDTFKSPDHAMRIEQYSKYRDDEGFTYQFGLFDKNHKNAFLLNADEDKDLAGYPAGFRFSPNSQWLVRMQGTGAGFATLLLYQRDGNRFVAATEKPLGELAWDYFFTQPASRGMPTEPGELNHKRADLLKGMEENYAWLGQKWPDSRYVVITLSFDIQGNDKPTPWIDGWRCVYDTQIGKFSVPAAFAEHNAQARQLPKPKANRG